MCCASFTVKYSEKKDLHINSFMPGIARGTIDFASTHSNGDEHTSTNPAETKYVPNIGAKVFIDGYPAIAQDDLTECGQKAVGCSSKVFIGVKGVHRLDDLCDSHNGTYSVSRCEQASGTVSAG
jgi:uncharacterized Zn-binding protein involved in type VI secretion